jgi:hypothetical protein
VILENKIVASAKKLIPVVQLIASQYIGLCILPHKDVRIILK